MPELVELLRCSSPSGRNAAAQTLAKLIAAYDEARCALLPASRGSEACPHVL